MEESPKGDCFVTPIALCWHRFLGKSTSDEQVTIYKPL